MRLRLGLVFALLAAVSASAPAQPDDSVRYRLSFPERAHRLLDVEALFANLPEGPLQLRMSRSSPGRYALHEFAKNVLDVRATDGQGRPLSVVRPDPYGWTVTGHAGAVRVEYRVFGDRIDGTYLGVDSTHAHINMPAALMWARGLEGRRAIVRFEPPAESGWRVATQLFPAPDGAPHTFTAPNLQYLMDSPVEVSAFSLRSFRPAGSGGREAPTIHVAVHHDGVERDLDGFVADVRRIVDETRHVFDEFPAFDGGSYTFIADYLPWANGDGMEHRNSTVVTSPSSIRTNRLNLLDTIAHEFFHAWNVERIRPASLEPFDFERVNMSGELWLGEGFTSYYGPLVLRRAGLTDLRQFAAEMGEIVNAVVTSPGRSMRSVREMSQLAPFVDAAASIDRTSFEHTYVSYYTWGAAIGLGLDLTLRERTDGRVTLDHFMRALWRTHGRPGGKVPGSVDRPYTPQDLETALASASGDRTFARDFFARYVEGREVLNYGGLLARAGIALRRVTTAAWVGPVRVQDSPSGVRVMTLVPPGTPAREAGLERDDVIVSLGDERIENAAGWQRALQERKPGESVAISFLRRGQPVSATLRLAADPRLEALPVEEAGQALTPSQRAFREAWLQSAGGN
jgi:predicted metalloprotease with PDZ domain